jgi:putative inorganic carbon (HCO3(-)) transporter
MNPSESFASRAARWLTFASAVSILFGIAPSQILLALAIVALLLSGETLSLPPIKLPLALFILGTLIAFALAPHPAEGLPQIRKLYVFLELVVVYSCLRDTRTLRWLILTFAACGSIAALLGVVQFVEKIRQAHQVHQDVYSYYVGERITGFMNHWNFFAAQEMFALAMLAAFLLFGPWVSKRIAVWIVCAGLLGLGIVLAETRAVWIGSAVAGVYLIWFWRKWLVLAIPVLVLAAFFVSPPVIKDRLTSMLHGKQVDSNAFRIVTWRTGLRMIEAHPLLGLGPEGPNHHFSEWVPADVPRPLPEGWYGHLHNIYLQYSAERGIPTMLILMWLLGRMLYDFWRALQNLPPGRSDQRYLLQGGIAVILATLAEGFFEYNLGTSVVLTMFLVIVAAAYRAVPMNTARLVARSTGTE